MTRTEPAAARLFGTDGIRGVAGRYPLDRSTVSRLGAALVRSLPRQNDPPRLLVGRDTRESGVWIEDALSAGACGEGATITSVGVAPTPAVAYLTQADGHDAGVVISASHNLFEDNGIKVFSGRGEKFTERVEREVESILSDRAWTVRLDTSGRVERDGLIDAYLQHLRGVLDTGGGAGIDGLLVAVDCANGATTRVAPALFGSLGIRTVIVGDTPDGRNINLDCGSTHPELLSRTVVSRGCQLGVAFDGDGDRAIFVDHTGRVIDGDAVLLMCARRLQREGRLKGAAVVATVMSNLGLEIALRETGIDLVRCPVGDKYVMEAMLERGLSLGGEQSGHIIFSEYLFTGDGLCTALNVLRTLAMTGRSLADLASGLVTCPQILLNVRVREKVDLSSVPAIAETMAVVESRLEGKGRLLVRYSGTEPLLRVMLEGQSDTDIRRWADEIVEVVERHLG